MSCGLVLFRTGKEGKLRYFKLLSSRINCSIQMPGRFFLLECIDDPRMYTFKLLPGGFH